MYISIIIIREGSTPRNWARAPVNKGKRGIIQYVLCCNSPMIYDNYITALGARSTIPTPSLEAYSNGGYVFLLQRLKESIH